MLFDHSWHIPGVHISECAPSISDYPPVLPARLQTLNSTRWASLFISLNKTITVQLNPSVPSHNIIYLYNILEAPVLHYLEFKPCLGMPASLPWQLCGLVVSNKSEAVTIVPYFNELLTSTRHKHISCLISFLRRQRALCCINGAVLGPRGSLGNGWTRP